MKRSRKALARTQNATRRAWDTLASRIGRQPPPPVPVLTATHLAAFREQGYLVLRQAVQPALCRAVVQGIHQFLGIPPQPHPSWYAAPVNPNGMVEMYHHQAQWDMRQHHTVYSAFAQLYGNDRLSVSFDRAHFKPPSRGAPPGWERKGFLHVDGDPVGQPDAFALQGIIALSDTDEYQGCWHCLPGWHRRTADFLALCRQFHPEQAVPHTIAGDRMPEIAHLRPVPMREGDLLLWHIGLPHGPGCNDSDQPRMVQYVLMYPTHPEDMTRPARIRAWREHSGPLAHETPYPFPGDERGWERQHRTSAKLTALGQRLVGVRRW